MGYLDSHGLGIYTSLFQSYIDSTIPNVEEELTHKIFIGTKNEFESKESNGEINENCIVILTDE